MKNKFALCGIALFAAAIFFSQVSCSNPSGGEGGGGGNGSSFIGAWEGDYEGFPITLCVNPDGMFFVAGASDPTPSGTYTASGTTISFTYTVNPPPEGGGYASGTLSESGNAINFAGQEFTKKNIPSYSPYAGIWAGNGIRMLLSGDLSFVLEAYGSPRPDGEFKFQLFAKGAMEAPAAGSTASEITHVWDEDNLVWTNDPGKMNAYKTFFGGTFQYNAAVNGSGLGSVLGFGPASLVKGDSRDGSVISYEGGNLVHTGLLRMGTNMNQTPSGTGRGMNFDQLIPSNHSAWFYRFPEEAAGYAYICIYYTATILAEGVNQSDAPLPTSGNGCKIIVIDNAEFQGGGPFPGQWTPAVTPQAPNGEYTLNEGEGILELPLSCFNGSGGLKLMLKDSPAGQESDFFNLDISRIVYRR